MAFAIVESRIALYDPQTGDIWEHCDGGSMYIVGRKPKWVRVQRRPFGDSQALPFWLTLPDFGKRATGCLYRKGSLEVHD